MRALSSYLVGLSFVVVGAVGCGAPEDDSLGADPDAVIARPVLPAPGGVGALSPWGGSDPSRWRPEAILANATSLELNVNWARRGVRDVVVAVPTHMLGSEHYQYGDGQANARPSFEWWREPRPPVTATLVTSTTGSRKAYFCFDRALPYRGTLFVLRYGTQELRFNAPRNSAGDALGSVTVPSGLNWTGGVHDDVALVHPDGWQDWFPVHFRMPVRPIRDLMNTVPANLRTFADGRPIVDPMRGTSQGMTSPTLTPFQRLSGTRFPNGYNQAPYTPANIHAEFPENGGMTVTGVGQGWTWVADRPLAPFKIMYTCFQARQPAAEANAPHGGVASGGGWHRVGDLAETILNSLEAGPLVVGFATGNPRPVSSLPGGGFSYGLNDVATVRWLLPGEDFVVGRGTAAQPNYHWYYFAQSQNVCTEEWVHPCRPANGDPTFQCE